jgi:hypothetical protein
MIDVDKIFAGPSSTADIAWIIVSNKIRSNLEKIMPGFIRVLADHQVLLAGGAIGSIMREETPADYDFYIQDGKILSDLLRNDCFIQGRIDAPWFKEVYKSDSAITYTSSITGSRIQIIYNPKIIGNVFDIINKFDFTICMCAYNFANLSFYCAKNYLTDNISKRLVFNINTPYPISSLYRLQKYIKKGYKFSGIDSVKMALTINSLHIKTINDLKDQLQGVDTLALKDLTDKLGSFGEAAKSYEFKTLIDFIDSWYMEKLQQSLDPEA